MNYPRLLVLSNNSFSKSNSNGRTLGSLLQGWPKDRIAQFCISSDGADFDVCENYYCVTDGDVLHSIKHFRSAARRDLKHSVGAIRVNHTKKKGIEKTTFSMIARNILWTCGIWRGKEFAQWINNFAPEIILLQSGDSYFMHLLALKLSTWTNAQLAIFNTEGYYFFKHDYFSKDSRLEKFFYPLYRALYRRVFKKFMNKTAVQIYCNTALQNDYDSAFNHHNSFVCYTGSDVEFKAAQNIASPPTFSYLGNLGIKRTHALAEFAEILQKVAPKCHIDVYGKLPSVYDGIFERTDGIKYHGIVSYDKVKEIIACSDFLVHVEKNDPVLLKELKYAFSTKIADSVCSGRNFIVYAPASLACSQYIADTGAAWLASTKTELCRVLEKTLTDKDARAEVLTRAKIAATKNHDSRKNADFIHEILCSVCHKQ